MHIKQGTDLVNFIKAVRKCRDNVYFETDEGDCLSLKSSLCQYIFASFADHPEILYEGDVRCENPEDETALEEFLCR